MQPTGEEAASILDEVADVSKEIHLRASYGIVGPILIVWGTIWTVCFSVTQFMPRISWWVWLIGDSIGLACTIYFGWLCPQVIAVDSKVDRRVRRRIFWSWFFLFVYADVWLAILWPWGGEQLGTFLVTLIMFAYVMMGIWLGLRFLLWLGLGVTIVAFAGHFISSMMPGYQNLLLGLSGGTTMLMSGIYLTRRYRTANG